MPRVGILWNVEIWAETRPPQVGELLLPSTAHATVETLRELIELYRTRLAREPVRVLINPRQAEALRADAKELLGR